MVQDKGHCPIIGDRGYMIDSKKHSFRQILSVWFFNSFSFLNNIIRCIVAVVSLFCFLARKRCSFHEVQSLRL